MTKALTIEDLPLDLEQKRIVLEWFAAKVMEVVNRGANEKSSISSPVTIQGNTITSTYLSFDDYHGDKAKQNEYDFKDLKDAEDILIRAFGDEIRAHVNILCTNCRYPDGN